MITTNETKPKTRQIPLDEISIHPMSKFDGNMLFFWKGDLYRAIVDSRSCKELFQKDIVRSLVDKGLLVQTELTDFSLEGYEQILNHRRLPFVSYPHEWCGEMLRDAALLVLDLEIELARDGFGLHDSHAWNVLFDGSRPVFVDFSSISPWSYDDNAWLMYDEFCRCFLCPLRLIAQGYGEFARYLLQDALKCIFQGSADNWLLERINLQQLGRGRGGVHAWLKRCVPSPLRQAFRVDVRLWLKSWLPGPLRPAFRKIRSELRSLRPNQSRMDILYRVREEVESMVIPSLNNTWRDPFEDECPPFCSTNTNQWTAKHESVYKIVSDVKPSSILDLGSNKRWLSDLAGMLGSNVIAFDTNSSCLVQLYREAKEKRLPVLPLMLDLKTHFPIYGLDDQWFQPVPDRLKCDMVLALGLVHNLVFKQGLNFEQIGHAVSALSKKWLLIEFMPQEDAIVREWWSQRYSWYTLENFKEILKRHYSYITVLPSSPEPRVLLLCKK